LFRFSDGVIAEVWVLGDLAELDAVGIGNRDSITPRRRGTRG
jgi:hypothetical protein